MSTPPNADAPQRAAEAVNDPGGRRRWLKSRRTQDEASRSATAPNAASPLGVLLYPYRLYVALAVVVVVPVLVILAVVR